MDFYEVDFLAVETKKSGDAIALRYRENGLDYIHVVDGGFVETGESLVAHIHKYYGQPTFIDNVVVTHSDGDHANGLRAVLKSFSVGTLWMLRPWMAAEQLLPAFPSYTSVDRLRSRLRSAYPNLVALEDIALAKGIPIAAPFQGAKIGPFTVLSPNLTLYLSLLVESEKTPETPLDPQQSAIDELFSALMRQAKKLVLAAWGKETFSPNPTSSENEMSVVQFGELCGETVLLTGDAGRRALALAAQHAHNLGVSLPGVRRFQVPHHGSRRNVSTALLDLWVGPRLAQPAANAKFFAYCSSALEDPDHPRNSVKRAIIHRGGRFLETEGKSICFGVNNPTRPEYSDLVPASYPDEEEED